MSIEINQVIIQIIAFLIMLWVLKKFGWKPLLDMLQERQKKIQSEFDGIQLQKDEIKKLSDEYQDKLKSIESEARRKIQEAIQEGRLIALEIQEEAQGNARELLSKARSEVSNEVAKAKNQLKNELVNMSFSIAEKLIQEKLNDSKHKQLVTELIDEAGLK
jgi:F-type H+-transporting ATPase subunit b